MALNLFALSAFFISAGPPRRQQALVQNSATACIWPRTVAASRRVEWSFQLLQHCSAWWTAARAGCLRYLHIVADEFINEVTGIPVQWSTMQELLAYLG